MVLGEVSLAMSELKAWLLDDDRGVSPVIGVILMVAITVILAAVIATFVMNMGPNEETAPTAQWSVEQQSDRVVLTHDGGGAAVAGKLTLNVESGGNDGGSVGLAGNPSSVDTSNTDYYDSDTELSASDSFEIVDSGASSNTKGVVLDSDNADQITSIELIWNAENSDTSEILTTWEP